MHPAIQLLFVTLLPYLALATVEYDRDGAYIIGAILPLTINGPDGKCTTLNPEGAAHAEAIKLAVDQISASSRFTSLISSTSIGYNIRDSCSDSVVERKVIYEFNKAALAYATNSSAPKPVDIVLSAFNLDSVNSLNLLNVESIPQISYSKDNAKLMQVTSAQGLAVQNLISVYPENTMAVQVVIDLINEYNLQYVHAIFSDDYQGKQASKLLTNSLKTSQNCADVYNLDDSNMDSTIATMKSKPLIKVIVMHCAKDVEKKFYQKLVDEDMTDYIIFSTQDWSKEGDSLAPYSDVTQGMIYIHPDRDTLNFEGRIGSVTRPYTNSPWLKALYDSYGGNAQAENKVKSEVSKASSSAIYSYESIYTIAEGLLKGRDLLEKVKGLELVIEYLGRNDLRFNDHLIAEGTRYVLKNIKKSSSQGVFVGSWENQPNREPLRLSKQNIEWKNGSKETPVSSCSETCALGFYREFTNDVIKCCWECKACPNGTFSNITNSNTCLTPCEGCVAKPDKTGYVKYEVQNFKWFGPKGSFLIFLIVLASCFILLALGIISQNSDHELIQLSGYNLLCLYLIGCLLLTLAPIPLLVTPTVSSCNGYIAVMNIGLTVIFAVMMTRTSYVNDFYDENGQVVKGGLGKHPRFIIIMTLIFIQALILIIVNNLYPPQTMHSATDNYAVKYAECSSWASWGFWVAFSFNIALSLIGNFMSCSSTKMEDICEELKWLLITYLIFYMNSLAEVIIFYRVRNEQLAVGQAVMCILMAMSFYFFFIWPKVWYVLFKSKDGKIQRSPEPIPQDDDHMTTAIHSSDAFKQHGVVQMRLKQNDAEA